MTDESGARLRVLASAAALLLAAGAASARGGGPSGGHVPQSGSPIASQRPEGRVQSVDPSTRTLTLAGSGKKLRAGPSTQVVKDGTTTSFGDIAPGDEVRASVLEDDPSYVLRLDVTTPSRR